MTIKKAIKILSLWESLYKDYDADQLRVALNLGIEALKRIKSQYDPDHQMMRIPLPGETKED